MACATVRALANVKSSAMMPRQPSVPNFIEVIENQYKRSGGKGNSRIGSLASRAMFGSSERALQEIFAFLFFEVFDDLRDVLGTVAGADEGRVGSFNDDDMVDAEQCGEFAGNPDEVAV